MICNITFVLLYKLSLRSYINYYIQFLNTRTIQYYMLQNCISATIDVCLCLLTSVKLLIICEDKSSTISQ